jgi:hypothetical protein
MSTRATYRVKFISEWDRHSLCFYIHYDGYPEGAAHYFQEMLKIMAENRRKRCIEAFAILPFSEITPDHETHGDTEYRYDICSCQEKGNTTTYVKAFERKFEPKSWVEFFDGTIEDFIEEYSKKNPEDCTEKQMLDTIENQFKSGEK